MRPISPICSPEQGARHASQVRRAQIFVAGRLLAQRRVRREHGGRVRVGRAGSALLGILSVAWLSGCALTPLPRVAPAEAHAAAPISAVRLQGAHGDKSAKASAQTLRAVRAEGRRDEFENHLAILQAAGETLSTGNELELLVDGPESFASMLAALETAQHRILLESYIFEAEDIGAKMAAVLLRKRAEGVSVHVIYDAVGSFSTPASFFDELRAGGIELCEFNPVSPLRRFTGFLQLNHRDHRKVLVVDDEVAFTGGINISSVYSSGSIGSSRRQRRAQAAADDRWRDTHVRIAGPAARAFIDSYRATWSRQNCAGEAAPVPYAEAGGRTPAENGDRLVAVIDSPGDEDSTRFYRALLGAIDNATASIHITMAYFVPDPQLVEALRAAAQRGVEVVLVLPGRSDSVLVLRAGQAHYADLMAAGVHIYEKHDAVLHAKTAVIDGVWATIGSSNLDWRSFLHNDELNVIVLGRQFGADMEALFVRDLERARRVDADEWETRGAGRRLMESFGNLWEYWL